MLLCFISPSTACSMSLCCCLWCWLFEPCLLRKQGHAWERAPLNVTITIHVFSRHLCQRQPFYQVHLVKEKDWVISKTNSYVLSFEIDLSMSICRQLPILNELQKHLTHGPEPWIFLWLVSLQIIVVTPHDLVMNYLSWNCNFLPRPGWDDSQCLEPGPKTENC